MNQWIGILGAIAIVAGLVFLLRNNGDDADLMEQKLHRLCRGDKQMMERLIAHEEKKEQGRSREAAVRAAIDSLKRDNR